MSLTLGSIENRIKQYEEEITKVVANHASLVGGLNELKQLLTLANEAAPVIAPSAAPVIEAVAEVVDAVDAAVQPAE